MPKETAKLKGETEHRILKIFGMRNVMLSPK